jgi:L-aspartate oxidase
VHRTAGALAVARVREVADRRDFEDVALALTARAVTAAALARNESRGCHHRAEYSGAVPEEARSIVVRLMENRNTDDPNAMHAEVLAAVS